MVERHNELLRKGLHLTETQMINEGLTAPFAQVLAITTFAKNALTVINESTPYQAVLGRQPRILPPLEGGYQLQMDDSPARDGSHVRNQARIREIAAGNIIEATAKMRLQRADRHKTIAAGERSELTPGTLVDLWFEPTNKDVQGWRGPGKIMTVQADEGNVTIRYQGRSLDRRFAEVRPHLPYLVFFSGLHSDLHSHWDYIR